MPAPVTVEEWSPGARHVVRRDRTGWSVDMHVVDLPGGGTFVYAPIRGAGAHLGDARVLVAPNAYHHLGLPEARKLAPDALVTAGSVALPRLREKGHEGVRRAEEQKIEGVELIACAGTKAGETWAFFPERRLLLVADAFFHEPGPMSGFTGFVLRRLHTAPGLCLGSTFRWLALADNKAYKSFAEATLERLRPTSVGFCDGAMLRGEDATDRLLDLLRRTL